MNSTETCWYQVANTERSLILHSTTSAQSTDSYSDFEMKSSVQGQSLAPATGTMHQNMSYFDILKTQNSCSWVSIDVGFDG